MFFHFTLLSLVFAALFNSFTIILETRFPHMVSKMFGKRYRSKALKTLKMTKMVIITNDPFATLSNNLFCSLALSFWAMLFESDSPSCCLHEMESTGQRAEIMIMYSFVKTATKDLIYIVTRSISSIEALSYVIKQLKHNILKLISYIGKWIIFLESREPNIFPLISHYKLKSIINSTDI